MQGVVNYRRKKQNSAAGPMQKGKNRNSGWLNRKNSAVNSGQVMSESSQTANNKKHTAKHWARRRSTRIKEPLALVSGSSNQVAGSIVAVMEKWL